MGMKIGIVLGFVLLLMWTNRWMGWEEGIQYMYGQDVPSYVHMAQAAPGLYTQSLPFHLAQRFFASYLAGEFSQICHISIPSAFCILMGLSLILTLFFFHLVLEAIGLGIFSYTLTMAFFIFNPYIFRFYMLVPGDLNATLFICAMAALMLGLLKRNMILILGAGIVGILSRQSMLVVLPSVLWWVLAAGSWQDIPIRRRLIFAGAIIFAIYAGWRWTGYIAGLMTPLSFATASYALGLLTWIARHGFQWKIITELVLRSFMPHVFALTFMAGIFLKLSLSPHTGDYRWSSKLRHAIEFFSCLLIGMFISVQPILAGPEVTGYPKGSGTRLGAMGLVAMMTALALLMKRYDMEKILKENRIFWMAAIVILVVNSWHHMYSWVLPFSMEGFIALNFISAFVLGVMCFCVL